MIRPLLEHPIEQNARSEIPALTELAVRGLVTMFDRTSNRFPDRVVRTERGVVPVGFSARHTLISILGLHRAQEFADRRGIDIPGVLAGLVRDTRWVDSAGVLGLLLWACAEAAPELCREICSSFDLARVLGRFHDARQGRTVGIAWFLSGLSHLYLVGGDQTRLRDLAMETYAILKQNQDDSGLFSHTAEKKSIAGLIRGRVGTFADQVYPIHALAKFSQSFGVPKAAERALDCALTLCELQGPLGQWWWHYDSATGKVLGRYPVYSVHQDGMAPLALFAIGDALQSDFRPWISKGLRWIFGDNELEEDLRDDSLHMIWGGVRRTDGFRPVDSILELLSLREDNRPHKEFAVLSECSPHHLGWLLYAWMTQGGHPSGSWAEGRGHGDC